jgi:hypothetical protein
MNAFLSRRALLRRSAAVIAASAVPFLQSPSPAEAATVPDGDVDSSGSTSPIPTFYVSAVGSDDADGLSPETSWATIPKVNSSLPRDRSIVLFRRDDTFYGEFAPPFGCEVGAFGAGERPILTMFKLLNRPDGWTEYASDVWRIDLGSPDTHDGYVATDDANIGYLMIDGTVMPALKLSISDLAAPWDFYCDIPNHALYVAASSAPTALTADIKAAPNGNAYGNTGRILYCGQGFNNIHDLHITGTGGCGIGGIAPDVHIHDCLIEYIGGSILLDGTNRRYGNGIENWVNVKRWLIEDNEIAQVYDAAWSPQGRAGTTGSWEDLTVRNNYIHDCSQSFEFWSTGTPAAGGFRNILVEGNFFERGGYSVFSDVRPDQSVRVHLNSYLWETPADITIQNNVFEDAYEAYSFHAREPVGLVTRNNTIRMKAGQKIQYQRPETVEEFAIWQEATGREYGSTMTIL